MNISDFYNKYKEQYDLKSELIAQKKNELIQMQNELAYIKGSMDILISISECLQNENNNTEKDK